MTALSVVLPVHDEAELLRRSVTALDAGCRRLVGSHEILLMENGSHDGTLAVARTLSASPRVRVFTDSRASYGQAMRAGLLHSRGAMVAVLNVDHWDLSFLRTALERLRRVDVVAGSKRHPDSRDARPLHRRVITELLNAWLRHGMGYPGSDTHGMKAFRRDALSPLAEQCVARDVLFDTELLLRAARAGKRITELPVSVKEVRDARSSVASRVVPTLLEASAIARGRAWSSAPRLPAYVEL